MFDLMFGALLAFTALAVALAAFWYLKVARIPLILAMVVAAAVAAYGIFNLAHGHF